MASSSNPGPVKLSFQSGGTSESVTFQQVDTKSRSSVPNWRSKLRSGQDASTSYTRLSNLVTTRSSVNYSVSRKFNVGPNYGKVSTATGNGYPLRSSITDPNTFPDWGIPTASENLAKTRFAQKVRSYDSKWQSGSFAGELGKTIRALRHPLDSMRKGINGYLEQVKKLASKPLTYSRSSRAYGQVLKSRQREALSRALTGTYLEWKFGVTPIVYDMIDAQKAYHQIVSKPHVDLSRVSASAEWDYKTPLSVKDGGSVNYITGAHPYGGLATYAVVWTNKQRHVRGRVTYSGAISADLVVGGALPALQLLPRDFVPTIWQLLPWSWAIDYVANVGDMLDVLSTSFGALVWCNRSTLVTIDQEFSTFLDTAFADAPALWTSATSSGGACKLLYTSRRYSRGIFVPSIMNMVPSLMFRSPSLNQGLNLAAALHQADSVSRILAQRYA